MLITSEENTMTTLGVDVATNVTIKESQIKHWPNFFYFSFGCIFAFIIAYLYYM